MYKNEFENLLDKQNLPRCICLYGENTYEIVEYAQSVEEFYKQDDSNVVKMYFSDYNYKVAKLFFSEQSLFGERNILIIKTEDSINQKELKDLVQTCLRYENAYFLLEIFQKADISAQKAKAIATMPNSFNKAHEAINVRFFNPKTTYEASLIMQRKARKINLNIDNKSLEKIYLTHHEDINASINELYNLSLRDEKITIANIESLIDDFGKSKIQDFITCFFNKNFFAKNLEILQERGVSEFEILFELEKFLYTIFLIRAYFITHGNINLKEILGFMPPRHIGDEYIYFSKKINIKMIQKALEILSNCDLDLKLKGKSNKQATLISYLLNLQANI